MSHEDQPVDRNLGDYQDEAATQPDAPTKAAFPSPAEDYPDGMGGVDPFALWAATSGKPLTSPPVPGTSTPPVRRAKSDPRARPRPMQQDRRKLVKLLVVGTAGLVTVITVGGVSFARSPHSATQSPSRIGDDRSEGSTSIDAHREMDDEGWGWRGRQRHKTPTLSRSPTPQPSPSPTQTPPTPPTPTPPMPPTPVPTPPSHTGTVIGYTNQATNSAVKFTNPADGQMSLLIHNGNFVACESACTHVGCPVNYDPTSMHLVCPCHDAIFDPLNGFSQVPGSGPQNLKPLPKVTIRVNADGTITTG